MNKPKGLYLLLALALVLGAIAAGNSTANASGSAARRTPTPTPTNTPPPITPPPPGPAPNVGSSELAAGWALRSAKQVADGGATLSQVGYSTAGWYPTNVPSTVLAALVANGVYNDIYVATNLKSVPDLTRQDWWYRLEFTAPDAPAGSGQQYWLRFKGITYRAEIWLNGMLLDGNAAGCLPHHDYNVTSLIQPGAANALAVKVTPPSGSGDLSFWYVDWNPAPPDMNAGIWNKVLLDTTGAVALRDPYVVTDLPLPATNSADLTVYVDALNGANYTVTGTLKGEITKAGQPTISFSQPVTLDPGERREIAFTPATTPVLHVANPVLWWPFGLGSPELYNLRIWLETGATPQTLDTQSIDFGIREFSEYTTPSIYGNTYWGVKVNGQNILIRGAAYVWDMLVRWSTPVNEAHMQYVKDMGLNTVRFEGILGNEEIYDIADREGILLMPGFVCCSAWEEANRWTAEELSIANASLESQARSLRHHASAFVWLYGSDTPPPESVLSGYKSILAGLHWQNLTRDNVADWANPSCGVKMDGPYKWEPPNYWYEDTTSGGAFGFCAEQGGESVPPLESLQKFIPADDLWPVNATWNYHTGTKRSVFDDISVYSDAADGRYGASANVDEFAMRSQLMNYEAARAQFEGYGGNAYSLATGTIYWMLNNGWPSLHWHLYDYYMKPGGGYFGTKKAMEPVHVLWDYYTGQVKVFNSTLSGYSSMTVSARVYNTDLTQMWTDQATLATVGANGVTEAFTIPSIAGLSPTYLIRLELRDSAGSLVSSNLYWYSTSRDVLKSTSSWYVRLTTAYADLTGLNTLPSNSSLTAAATRTSSGGIDTVTITLSNPVAANKIAFFVRAEVTKGSGGEEVLPVTYTDNYITLWPGESATIVATYKTSDLGGQPAALRVRGYNVPEFLAAVP